MQREDFPILHQLVHGRPLVYLDNAATTQKPQVVLDSISEAYSTWNANIHRGVHSLSQEATRHHEASRQRVAAFLGARSANEIIFTRGTTDSINLLAFSFGEYAIEEGDEILIGYAEHHSNIVPWQMLCERKKAVLRIIPLSDDGQLDMKAFVRLLTRRTKLLSIAHVGNVLGLIQPVEEMIRLAHANGIAVCVDGAQSAAHLPINVQDLDCDFFVCSAHKMYGPTGIGVLYGKEEWLDKLPPAQGGGEMIEHVRFDRTTYNVLPYKFEAGTPDFIGSYAFVKALDYIDHIGREHIQTYESELCHYLESRLQEIKDIHIYAAGHKKAGVVSFNIGSLHPFDVGTLLDQQGVAVRTGHHCAEPLIDWLGIPGTIRASLALYNNKDDIDRLIKALQVAVSMLQ